MVEETMFVVEGVLPKSRFLDFARNDAADVDEFSKKLSC